MISKICNGCKRNLEIDCYHNDISQTDGKKTRCKDCYHLKYREWYLNNRAHVLKYKKDHIAKLRKENPGLLKRWSNQEMSRNKSHIVARGKLLSSVYYGKIIRPKLCPICGDHDLVHGHHEDYSKPLEVDWCCRSCHDQIHGK